MTARIAGFVTRADARLPRPRSVSRNIEPHRGGVAIHHGGDGLPPATHAGAIERWRSWHAFHTGPARGWEDIAYTAGVDQEGYVFAGRGAGVRTAANGTNDANLRYYAVVWLGGGGAQPTRAALDALEWVIADLRAHGGAGRSVRSHRQLKPSTACAGDALTRFATALDDAPVPPGPLLAASSPAAVLLKQDGHRRPDRLPTVRAGHDNGGWDVLAQRALAEAGLYRGRIDGRIEPGGPTERAVGDLQARHGLVVDRVIGPWTWAAMLATHGTLQQPMRGAVAIEVLQNMLGWRSEQVDGAFGPQTAERVRAVQRWGGLTGDDIDARVGPQTRELFTRV